jgi:hypothetical protein
VPIVDALADALRATSPGLRDDVPPRPA